MPNLILSRKPGESVSIGPDIRVTVVKVRGNQVRLSFDAPPELKILRVDVSGTARECKNCPIQEQTGDGKCVGRCWHYLSDGVTCPRHGDVSVEVDRYVTTGKTTLENSLRARLGKQLCGV